MHRLDTLRKECARLWGIDLSVRTEDLSEWSDIDRTE